MPSIVLMENAAMGATDCILNSTEVEIRDNIVLVCGCGNNGGDGYAVARHLANANCTVSILQIGEPQSSDAKTNATICDAMNIPMLPWSKEAHSNATLCIDAIFGTGLDRTIKGAYMDAIHACNEHIAPCISLDIPSGMDCDTGEPLGCCVNAWMTISFVGMKLGFSADSAKKHLGKIVIAEIGCPQVLLQKYGNGTS